MVKASSFSDAFVPAEILPVEPHFGIDLLFGGLGLIRVFDDLHAEGPVGDPEIPHAGEIAACLAHADVGHAVGHLRTAELPCHMIETARVFMVSGGNEEGLLVPQEQIAEVLDPVDAVVRHGQLGCEGEVRRGVDDHDGERTRRQGFDGFQRGGVGQMERGDGLTTAFLEAFHRIGELLFQAAGGAFHHFEAPGGQFSCDDFDEGAGPGRGFLTVVVVEGEVEGEKSDFHCALIPAKSWCALAKRIFSRSPSGTPARSPRSCS